MAGSMQILVLERAVFELEEKVKDFLKQINERLDLQDRKFEEYEKFLKSYEGGVSLPAKVEGKKHMPGEKEKEYGETIQKGTKEKTKDKRLKRRTKQEEKTQ